MRRRRTGQQQGRGRIRSGVSGRDEKDGVRISIDSTRDGQTRDGTVFFRGELFFIFWLFKGGKGFGMKTKIASENEGVQMEKKVKRMDSKTRAMDGRREEGWEEQERRGEERRRGREDGDAGGDWLAWRREKGADRGAAR